MGIKIEIPGLTEYIQKMPNGNVILVEGGINPSTSIFVQHLATVAHKQGRCVNYITSKTKEEVEEQVNIIQRQPPVFPIIEERSHRHWKEYISDESILVIDSFSYMVLDRSLADVVLIMEEFLRLCKEHRSIVILTGERGMLDQQMEITIAHLADGIFLFLSKDTSKGIARFIRVPKWVDGNSYDDNIYFTFDGHRINVDLRSRVR